LRLADRMPANAVRVAECGIYTSEDIDRLRAVVFNAFLVGESLMRHPEPGAALQARLAPAAEWV
jgi:indole-3-glycerol phosphate synthase